MNIVIIGAGMYVTGRGFGHRGTVLASLFESAKRLAIKDIWVVSKNASSKDHVERAVENLNTLLGLSMEVKYQALGDNYLKNFELFLAEKKIDVCINSTPDHMHFDYAKICALQGVHQLVVKPLVPTQDEAIELTNLAKQSKTYAAVEFHKRWDETNLIVRKKIEDRTLGDMQYMVVEYSQQRVISSQTFDAWIGQTNIFQYLGVHYVDLFYFLSGFTPIKAMAYGNKGDFNKKRGQGYDAVHASVIWENPENTSHQVYTQFNTNWIDPNQTSAMSDQKYRLIGSAGRVNIDQKNRGVELVTDEHGIESINPYFAQFFPDGDHYCFDGYGHKSINTFLWDCHHILSGKIGPETLQESRPTFNDAIVSSAVVEAVNKSLEMESNWININIKNKMI